MKKKSKQTSFDNAPTDSNNKTRHRFIMSSNNSSKKHIASRYLEMLNNNGPGNQAPSGPLQPSSKLNTKVDLNPKTPTKARSSLTSRDTTSKEQLSPARRLAFEQNDNANHRASSRSSPSINTRLQESFADLNLDSPSPLKRTSRPAFTHTSKYPESEMPQPQWTIANRKSQKGYEYLCRIGEAKEWIEKIIGEEIPPTTALANDALRDGVILAKLTKAFKPEFARRIVPSGQRLQFKHTENINVFFQFLDSVRMPDLFRFELTDLYDKKNIPKVIFCVHALSFMLAQDNVAPDMNQLSGKLDFTEEELKKLEGSLTGVNLPNFDSMSKQFGREIPKSPQKLQVPELKPSPIDDFVPAIPASPRPLPPQPEYVPHPSVSPKKNILKNPFLEADINRTPSNTRDYTSAMPKAAGPIEIPTLTSTTESDDFGDSLISGYSASPTKTRTLAKEDYLKTISTFQSIARGSIFRYGMFVDRIMLKSTAETIIQVQSLARRSLVVKKYRTSASIVSGFESKLVEFQSLIRAKKERMNIQELNRSQPDDQTVRLQSISRGQTVRHSIKEINYHLMKYDYKIIQLQSIIRGHKIFERTRRSDIAAEPTIQLQSQLRRALYQRKISKSVHAAHSEEEAIVIIQSVIRGSRIREDFSSKVLVVAQNEWSLLDLQSVARGGISRNKLNVVLDVLDFETPKLQELCAIAKGGVTRSRIQRVKNDLLKASYNVTEVQSVVRGVLSRFSFDLFLDNLDIYTDETIGLQASIRGYLYRLSKREVMKYYEGHIPAIIKIQSFIRGKYLGSAYKSLISMENPPLSVIKRFAYLLNDSDVDFEEEVRLTRIKESINEKTSSNELLEKHISQLDLKIALLQKNKITLDELLVQKNKSLQSSSHASTIDVSSLNRRAKTKMELYEKLFYLLQTQPLYLTRLIQNDYRGVDVALKIFNKLESRELPTREEYLFVYLIETNLKEFIKRSHSVDDLQKENSLGWQRLLRSFNETQKDVLAELFAPLVEKVMSDEYIDMECDPVRIYQTVHNTPKVLPVEKAIEDQDTKVAFINNLQQIREYGSEIYRILNSSIKRLPIHIKIIARAAFKASLKRFPQNLEQEHLANAGLVLISGLVNLVFEAPEFFGINPSNVSRNSVKNLTAVSKLLTQLFLMKPFSADDVYLQPLNKFINSSVDGVRSLLKSIVDVGEIDTVYNMTVYDDMTAHNRPKLTLRISDMLSIDELIRREVNVVAPIADDMLREVLVELQSNKASDISRLSGSYTLSLNPSSYKTSPEDSRMKSLSMQAKRCVLYMVQVQDAQNDLFELLKSRIDAIDEIKFKQMISVEKKDIKFNRGNEYVNDGQGFLGDLTNISYHKLKQIALERILELESIGRVTRKDSFQIILNEIANDIKTKHDQRLSRKKQLSVAENTLIRLDEKYRFLEDQLNAYNLHIDKSMEELQSKPSKPKRIMPFTKQFFYERELKKAGKLPKFGAYKYSSKRLYEKGILVELHGLNQDLGSSGSSFFGGFNFPKIDFMFNCDTAGVFTISSKSGTLAVNGSLETLTIDQLLEYQFENKSHIALFNGMAKFDTNCLINFIFKKFYHYIENKA